MRPRVLHMPQACDEEHSQTCVLSQCVRLSAQLLSLSLRVLAEFFCARAGASMAHVVAVFICKTAPFAAGLQEFRDRFLVVDRPYVCNACWSTYVLEESVNTKTAELSTKLSVLADAERSELLAYQTTLQEYLRDAQAHLHVVGVQLEKLAIATALLLPAVKTVRCVAPAC